MEFFRRSIAVREERSDIDGFLRALLIVIDRRSAESRTMTVEVVVKLGSAFPFRRQ
jgi:hypothetical protein